ncbi:MAG: DNA repair and recombination protein RadA [Promethearchaeota archaeon]
MTVEESDQFSLTTLGGEVGPSTLRLLKKAGFKDIRDIASSKSEELQEIQGIGEKVANNILLAARAKIPKFGSLKSARELRQIEEAQTYLSTGCNELDRILGGGFALGSLNQIAAGFGLGKTQLCFQAAIQAFLPPEEGGMGKSAVWIDTEGSFKARRVEQMARARGLDSDSILDNIHVGRAYNSEHQVSLVQEALAAVGELNAGLIVIDSLIAHFRAEYVGRGTLAARQQKLGNHISYLKRIIEAKRIVGLVTNQMQAKPDILFGDALLPAGGNIVGHNTNLILLIKKGKGNLRKFKVTKASDLPEEEIAIKLDDTGFSD